MPVIEEVIEEDSQANERTPQTSEQQVVVVDVGNSQCEPRVVELDENASPQLKSSPAKPKAVVEEMCESFFPESFSDAPCAGVGGFDGALERMGSALIRKGFDADYEVLEEIGRGSGGIVYKARSRHCSSSIVAVKLINIGRWRLAGLEPARAIREVEVLRKLDHPNIVKLHAVYHDGDTLRIVMDFVAGSELTDVIVQRAQKHETLSEEEARPLLRQLAEALSYLHEHGILHRDVKTDNVVVLETRGDAGEMQAKLLDFGLSTVLGSGYASVGRSAVGTENYAAPEICALQGRPPGGSEGYGPAVDMYSLGVTLYVMLSSRFPDFNENSCSKELVFRREVWHGKSDAAKDLIAKLMDGNPACRPSAAEVLNDPWLRGDDVVQNPCTGANPAKEEDQASDIVAAKALQVPHMQSTVSKSNRARLRLSSLAQLQRKLADALSTVHDVSPTSTSSTGSGAAEAAHHATLLCRDQLHRSATLLRKVGTVAEIVLETLDDLELALDDGEPALARTFFSDIAKWAGELKAETSTTQQELRNGILDLWEHARPVFGAPLTLLAQNDAHKFAQKLQNDVITPLLQEAANGPEHAGIADVEVDQDGPLQALAAFIPVVIDTGEDAAVMSETAATQHDALPQSDLEVPIAAQGTAISEESSPGSLERSRSWSESHAAPSDAALAAVVQILTHLEQVDGILESICSFWGEAESLLSAQLRRGEHVEAFLKATVLSPKLRERFRERLKQFRLFWVRSKDAAVAFKKIIDSIQQPCALTSFSTL